MREHFLHATRRASPFCPEPLPSHQRLSHTSTRPPTMQPHMSLHTVLSSPSFSRLSSRTNSVSPTEVTDPSALQFHMPGHSDQTDPSQSSQGPGFHPRVDTGTQPFQGNQTRHSTPGFMGSGFLSAGGPSVLNRGNSPISVRAHLCGGINSPTDRMPRHCTAHKRRECSTDRPSSIAGRDPAALQQHARPDKISTVRGLR